MTYEQLEDSDSLIEVHLHGPVTVENIDRIIMPRVARDRYFYKFKQWERKGRPNAHEYEAMPIFSEFLNLVKQQRIIFELAEGALGWLITSVPLILQEDGPAQLMMMDSGSCSL